RRRSTVPTVPGGPMSSAAVEVTAADTKAPAAFLSVRDLQIHFPTDDGLVKAVDGISFDLERGKTLGIVGESVSGKSVTSLGLMGLHSRKRTQMTGEVWLEGEELVGARSEQVRRLRGEK